MLFVNLLRVCNQDTELFGSRDYAFTMFVQCPTRWSPTSEIFFNGQKALQDHLAPLLPYGYTRNEHSGLFGT